MSVPHLLAASAAAQSTAAAATLTPGRLWSVVAVLLGSAGVVAGALALARSTGRGGAALTAGSAGSVVGGLIVATADGGPGSGSGIVGGYVALVVGVTALALGVLARARSRRAVPTGPASAGTSTAGPNGR